MPELSNEPDECLVCGQEYDALLVVDGQVEVQTQGKANQCIDHHPQNGSRVFLHFAEKWV